MQLSKLMGMIVNALVDIIKAYAFDEPLGHY